MGACVVHVVADLFSPRDDCTDKAVRRAVKYNTGDQLILIEGPFLMIKPTWCHVSWRRH